MYMTFILNSDHIWFNLSNVGHIWFIGARFTSCQLHFREWHVVNFKLHENHPCRFRRLHSSSISLYLLFGTSFLETHIPHRNRSFPHAANHSPPKSCDQEARAPTVLNSPASHRGSVVLIPFSFLLPLLVTVLFVTMSLKRQVEFLYGDAVSSSPLKIQCRTFQFLVAEDPSTPINRPRDKSLGRTIILRVHEGDDYPFHTQDFWVPSRSRNLSYWIWGKRLIVGPFWVAFLFEGIETADGTIWGTHALIGRWITGVYSWTWTFILLLMIRLFT